MQMALLGHSGNHLPAFPIKDLMLARQTGNPGDLPLARYLQSEHQNSVKPFVNLPVLADAQQRLWLKACIAAHAQTYAVSARDARWPTMPTG